MTFTNLGTSILHHFSCLKVVQGRGYFGRTCSIYEREILENLVNIRYKIIDRFFPLIFIISANINQVGNFIHKKELKEQIFE